jgi:polysaccharide biosynthesis/export protein
MSKIAIASMIVATTLFASRPLAADDKGDKEKDRVIKTDDKLTVTIDDLQGPGIQTAVKAVVDKKGQVTLPHLTKPVTARGLTCQKLERAVVKAYRDANLIAQATVSVKFRGEEKENEGL